MSRKKHSRRETVEERMRQAQKVQRQGGAEDCTRWKAPMSACLVSRSDVQGETGCEQEEIAVADRWFDSVRTELQYKAILRRANRSSADGADAKMVSKGMTDWEGAAGDADGRKQQRRRDHATSRKV